MFVYILTYVVLPAVVTMAGVFIGAALAFRGIKFTDEWNHELKYIVVTHQR